MTTEEALAVAESVQFGITSSGGGFPQKPPMPTKTIPRTKPTKNEKQELLRKHYDPPGGTPTRPALPKPVRPKRKGSGHQITIHAQHVQFSDTQQFAEATKARYDAAERQAMRRAIYFANIHPAIKESLMRHSAAVQFSDDGDEVPSVPMTWVLAAAKGILQMAIEPQTMQQMNAGMLDSAMDSLYSGDNDALDVVSSLLEDHGLHEELLKRLRARKANKVVIDRAPIDERENKRAASEMGMTHRDL